MLKFDPNEPFPLLKPGRFTYASQQKHSQRVDEWLGLETSNVEQKVETIGEQQIWAGFPVQSILTPYTEIREILNRVDPQPHETIVDLGAGYGRMGFVVAEHYPDVRFVGYEIVEERVLEGQRCLERMETRDVELQLADLSDATFKPVEAEYYFIYDFGTRKAIEKSLHDLRSIANGQSISVIGRGTASRDAIERRHPWLSQVVPPEHFPHYSIYRSGS